MNNKEKVLEVNHLYKTFYKKRMLKKPNETKVLIDVNFEIFEGETVALVGESGSGKSTTARIVLGLENKTDGSILFRGQELKGLFDKDQNDLRKDIQFVFQDPVGSINPRMKIWRIISEPLLSEKLPREKMYQKVQEILEKVGLNKSDAEKYPHQFSGGQLQRVGIARALILRSSFIILDEPTSALDVSVQAKILKLLKSLQKEFKLTYLFITHDLNVVESFADRVLVMKKGQIVEEGTTEELFRAPKHAYTKKLLDSNLLAKSSNVNTDDHHDIGVVKAK